MRLYKNNDILEITNKTNFFNITWYITGWCNYHCPYCINSNMKCSWISEEIILNRAEKLNNLINALNIDKPISLKLLGGEVTYYDLIAVLDKIKKLAKIILITNLSQPISYFINLARYLDSREIKFILICSKHEENNEFDSKFIALNDELKKLRKETNRKFAYFEPQLNIVVDNNFNWKSLRLFEDAGIKKINPTVMRDLNEKNLDVTMDTLQHIDYYKQIQLDYFKHSKDTSKGNKEINYSFDVKFNTNTEEFTSLLNLTNFIDANGFIGTGYNCSCGINTLAILPNGNIVKSNCLYLADKPLGNIDDNIDIKLDNELVKCKLKPEQRCILVSGANICK